MFCKLAHSPVQIFTVLTKVVDTSAPGFITSVLVSASSVSTAKILITAPSCFYVETVIKIFFQYILQFLLGEMVNVLLLGVLSVRVVGIDQIDRKDDGSGGNK